MTDVRIHDLRHTFASMSVAANISLPVIGGLMGHKSTATTQRYAHLMRNTGRQAANRVATDISKALGQK
jgi:site-specific recombinase XerD